MTYTLCILWTLAVALWAAADDAERIALNEPIHHVRSWFIRAALVAVVCLAAGHPWLTVGMGALFSMAFRYTLNKVRDLDWRYVSPSSWYDWQFIRVYRTQTIFANGVVPNQREEDVYRHGNRYECSGSYRIKIHRAGLLAYIVEFVVLALTILLV